jgi:polysaccharide export outer membrane protein
VAQGVVLGVLGLLVTGCAQNELGRYTGFQLDQWVVNNPKRVRNAIVKSENYWIQKEVQPEEQFPGPTPTDLRKPEKDYILGAGDLADITVFELMQPGMPYVARQRITQTGHITFPYIGTVKAAGLTTRGLEEKLADMLEPDYLINPQVSVFVVEYRNLNVAVLNGVMRAGIYPMTREDMTLLELVAMAGGILQLTEDFGYVIREYSPDEADLLMLEAGVSPTEGAGPVKGPKKPAAEATPGEAPPLPAEKAPAKAGEETPGKPAPEKTPAPAGASAAPAPKAPADAATSDAKKLLEKMAEGDMPPVGKIDAAEAAAVTKTPAVAVASAGNPPKDAPKPAAEAAKPAAPDAAAMAKDEKELGRWIWSDGKWVEVKEKTLPEGKKPVEGAKPPEPTKAVEGAKPVEVKAPETPTVPEGTKLAQVPDAARLQLEQKLRRLGVVQGSGQLKRIIRFDVKALQSGDPTQNVVLRDGDIVTIPSPTMGDFYMVGEVARPGVYSLTGRKISLLQAVAAAGGLTAVAVPWRTELVRRVSEGEEDIIYVDLGKISRGEAPDFYLQADDHIRVGTDEGAIFNAVIRNAFRATYGLGFVYDMNFADFYPWRLTRRPFINE